MNGVNKTLYIPLFGKAYVSKRESFFPIKRQRKSGLQKALP